MRLRFMPADKKSRVKVPIVFSQGV